MKQPSSSAAARVFVLVCVIVLSSAGRAEPQQVPDEALGKNAQRPDKVVQLPEHIKLQIELQQARQLISDQKNLIAALEARVRELEAENAKLRARLPAATTPAPPSPPAPATPDPQ